MKGKEVKAFRRKLRLSQKELADKLGISQSNISIWENTRRDLRLMFPHHNNVLERFFYEEAGIK